MKSQLPKVLQPLAGRPLLAHSLASVAALKPAQSVVVVGHGAEQVKTAFADQTDLRWALQSPQNGTGHAAAAGLACVAPINNDGITLLVTGDTPLIQACKKKAARAAAALLGAGADPNACNRFDQTAQGQDKRF